MVFQNVRNLILWICIQFSWMEKANGSRYSNQFWHQTRLLDSMLSPKIDFVFFFWLVNSNAVLSQFENNMKQMSTYLKLNYIMKHWKMVRVLIYANKYGMNSVYEWIETRFFLSLENYFSESIKKKKFNTIQIPVWYMTKRKKEIFTIAKQHFHEIAAKIDYRRFFFLHDSNPRIFVVIQCDSYENSHSNCRYDGSRKFNTKNSYQMYIRWSWKLATGHSFSYKLVCANFSIQLEQ